MAESRRNLVDRLFAEQGVTLLGFLRRRVQRQPDAADLAQEVYLRMLRVPDIDAIQSPESYLFTIAKNLVRERAHEEVGMLDVDNLPLQDEQLSLHGAPGDLDQDKRIERLREVLEQLPPKCRAVVALRHWHDQSYQEIASQLGISTNMVKKYLGQALLHCRRRMARLG